MITITSREIKNAINATVPFDHEILKYYVNRAFFNLITKTGQYLSYQECNRIKAMIRARVRTWSIFH